jgi:hypothetical protein
MASIEAEMLRNTALIIWDESTMVSSLALSVVDKLLKEIMQNDRPLGGKTIFLGGYFRQTLPVVPR